MENLDCSNNNLECLNVTNGNNLNLWSFISNGNENLDCIQVDDTTWNTVPPIIDFFMVDSDVLLVIIVIIQRTVVSPSESIRIKHP